MNLLLFIILSFTFLFPIIMTYNWLIGGILYSIKNRGRFEVDESLKNSIDFEIVVPVYNEVESIAETLNSLLEIDYDNYVIKVIDDNSTDGTQNVIEHFVGNEKIVSSFNTTNMGKAKILNQEFSKSSKSYILVIDSDTTVEPDILNVLCTTINNSDTNEYIAFSGNPQIKKDQNTLLKIEAIEYRTIIGMIKKAQQFWFKNIFSISGAITAYDVQKIKEIGYFNTENATEDIEVTWRLSKSGYKAMYLPYLYVYLETPETIYTLLKQRRRWSLGMFQTIKQHGLSFIFKAEITHKVFLLENILSGLWVVSFFITTTYICSRLIFYFPTRLQISQVILPTLILLITSFIYFTVAYFLEYGKKERFIRFIIYFWYYPIMYWYVQPFAYILAIYDFFTLREKGKWRQDKKRKYKLLIIISRFVDVFILGIFVFLIRMVIVEINLYFNFSFQITKLLVLIFITIVAYLSISYAFTKHTFGQKVVGIKQTPSGPIRAFLSPFNIGVCIYFFYYIIVHFQLLSLDRAAFVAKYNTFFNLDNGLNNWIVLILLITIVDDLLQITNKIKRVKIVNEDSVD